LGWYPVPRKLTKCRNPDRPTPCFLSLTSPPSDPPRAIPRLLAVVTPSPPGPPRHEHLYHRRSPQRREEGGCCIDPATSIAITRLGEEWEVAAAPTPHYPRPIDTLSPLSTSEKRGRQPLHRPRAILGCPLSPIDTATFIDSTGLIYGTLP
jgi:hypothetical protein